MMPTRFEAEDKAVVLPRDVARLERRLYAAGQSLCEADRQAPLPRPRQSRGRHQRPHPREIHLGAAAAGMQCPRQQDANTALGPAPLSLKHPLGPASGPTFWIVPPGDDAETVTGTHPCWDTGISYGR